MVLCGFFSLCATELVLMCMSSSYGSFSICEERFFAVYLLVGLVVSEYVQSRWVSVFVFCLGLDYSTVFLLFWRLREFGRVTWDTERQEG